MPLCNREIYYFAICTCGTAGSEYDSDYMWTYYLIPAKPQVKVGNKIKKSDMDLLRSYKNNEPTVVNKGDIIDTTKGNTYASATTSNKITASWYNNA